MNRNAAAFLASLVLLGWGCSTQKPRGKGNKASSPAPKLEKRSLGRIYNVHRFGDILLAGQPGARDFPLLKQKGIKSIMQMNDRSRLPFDEEALAKSQGMEYVYLPWNGPSQLTDAVFDRVREFLNRSRKPALLHCASANRVGATWLAWRVLDGGIPFDQALEEAREVGLRTPGYIRRAKEYIAKRKP